MKVEVNGKTYCAETLIADNERLRKEIIASAETTKLILDSVRAEINEWHNMKHSSLSDANYQIMLEIIDKHIGGIEE